MLVTGCDSGMGFETALRLDRRGFRVLATCLTDEGERQLRARSPQIATIRLDVTSDASVAQALEVCDARLRT